MGPSSTGPPGPSQQGGPGSVHGKQSHQSTLMMLINRFLALPLLFLFLLLHLVVPASQEGGTFLAQETLETNQWTAQALSTGSPGWTPSVNLWVLVSPTGPGWRCDSSPIQLAHMWATGLVTGAHSVAAVSIVVALSLLGVKQVILRPMSLGPLSEPCRHDGSGVLTTSSGWGSTGWSPQHHRLQTDSSLPSGLFSLGRPKNVADQQEGGSGAWESAP